MRVAALATALVVDRFVGEPAWHPVRVMGRAIEQGRDNRRSRTPGGSLLEGGRTLAIPVLLSALAGAGVSRLLGRIRKDRPGATSMLGAAVVEGVLLKPALALEALLDAGREVEAALRVGALADARRLAALHLVSRDTERLEAHEIASATIESLSENLVDSVIAPAAAYFIGGLPAAYAYRAVNTADAMVGYRSQELEWFGKPAALLDDVLNLVPARLAAIALLATRPGRGWWNRMVRLPREARRTDSPNSGWPMAAAALALEVRLEKPGAYRLNAAGHRPGADDVAEAIRIVRRGGVLLLGALGFGAAAMIVVRKRRRG